MSRTNKATVERMKKGKGTFVEDRTAWATASFYETIVYNVPEDDPSLNPFEQEEPGPTIRIKFGSKAGRAMFLNLSMFSQLELEQFAATINLAIDLARPVCELRDRSAEEAYENGNDAVARVYRQVPRFVVRKGPLGPDGERLLERLDRDALGLEIVEPRAERVRVSREPVAEPEPSNRGTEDDAPQAERL